MLSQRQVNRLLLTLTLLALVTVGSSAQGEHHHRILFCLVGFTQRRIGSSWGWTKLQPPLSVLPVLLVTSRLAASNGESHRYGVRAIMTPPAAS
jgi:hypothetical protein